MIKSETEQLIDQALGLFDNPAGFAVSEKQKETYHTYHLEIPDDIHWILVALGAGHRQHQEDYAETILKLFATLCYERMNEEDKNEEKE